MRLSWPGVTASLVTLIIAAPGMCAESFVGSAPEFTIPVSERAPRLGVRAVATAADLDGLLAQRTIERQWGPSDDSVYVQVDIPGWKSEPLAGAMSMTLPGTGQLYVGDKTGWLYLAVEASAWGGWWYYHHDSEKLDNQAVTLAGPPEVASSGWSYDRWSATTQADPGTIAALYAGDRDAYYNRIAHDPAYAAGWVNPSTHADFTTLRVKSEDQLGNSRYFSAGLWINHLVSAMTALRAARSHNMELRPKLGLKVRPHMDRRGPGITMVLVQKF
jgi:hypothetical protein